MWRKLLFGGRWPGFLLGSPFRFFRLVVGMWIVLGCRDVRRGSRLGLKRGREGERERTLGWRFRYLSVSGRICFGICWICRPKYSTSQLFEDFLERWKLQNGVAHVELPSLYMLAGLFACYNNHQFRYFASDHPFVELGHDLLDIRSDLVVGGYFYKKSI